jgi:hypothetical protein
MYKADPRTPDKLFMVKDVRQPSDPAYASSATWLCPLSRCMADAERQQAGARLQRRIQTIHTQGHQHARFIYPMDNTLYVLFPHPVSVGAIRFYNYSKTLERGVREFSIVVDNALVYMGSLDTADK